MSRPEHARGKKAAIDTYRERRQKAAGWLREQDLAAAVLVDFEGLRNASVRYLTGHPMDALLLLFADGRCLLVPWDVPLAEAKASVEEIVPYTHFGRSVVSSLKELLPQRKLGSVELSGAFPYPRVQQLIQLLPDNEILCRKGGIDAHLAGLRAVKDEEEIAALRYAGSLSDELVAAAGQLLAGGREVSETELALFLENEARSRGAEGMGFETLAAGPSRSFALHSFPTHTNAPFGAFGFSILDFGVRWEGYTSDVTLTVIRGPLSSLQERMREAAAEAYALALSLVKPGADPVRIAARVDRLMAERGFPMPHSLGHGLGLEAHEEPYLRQPESPDASKPLAPGMVVTLEPGAYHPEAGGVRLENVVLVTDGGAEELTHARILELR